MRSALSQVLRENGFSGLYITWKRYSRAPNLILDLLQMLQLQLWKWSLESFEQISSSLAGNSRQLGEPQVSQKQQAGFCQDTLVTISHKEIWWGNKTPRRFGKLWQFLNRKMRQTAGIVMLCKKGLPSITNLVKTQVLLSFPPVSFLPSDIYFLTTHPSHAWDTAYLSFLLAHSKPSFFPPSPSGR